MLLYYFGTYSLVLIGYHGEANNQTVIKAITYTQNIYWVEAVRERASINETENITLPLIESTC